MRRLEGLGIHNMPLPPRLFPGDVELGKRDDDHKPGAKSPLGLAWQHRRMPNPPHIGRRSMKRAAAGLLVLIALYYFFKNMPTDLENPRQRPNYAHGVGVAPTVGDRPISATVPPASAGSSKQIPGAADLEKHDFNGPIKFYHLAATLHAVSRTGGTHLINHNVLFAAASLKSAATLLPIACEMAIRASSYVHFALMGRDDISMDILKSVNSISAECPVLFHDGRPDFSVHSSDFRMEVSAAAGYNHINTFVHPQATFVDASGDEELWFLKGIRERAVSLGRTVIELPENAERDLMWITMLDSSALSNWNKASVDIIVHAQPSSSGSLIRLLESLKKADFFSSAIPRLTIELPHNVDEGSRRYLENFDWPPQNPQNAPSLLKLHHRIPQHGLTAEENTIRQLETFWPSSVITDHVLILSPSVELSPLFYHYLKYTLLEYRYSARKAHSSENFMGISLDLPSTYLNDTTNFAPPVANHTVGGNLILDGVSPFLWQAPNSNAALYFGDKWVELHDFVAHLLTSQHTLATPTTLNGKDVSKTYPSWLEHVLKLCRARGYWFLYPNFGDEHEKLAEIHTDLYQPPEEFKDDISFEEVLGEDGELLADPSKHKSLEHTEGSLIKTSLLSIMPFGGDLPAALEMPLLTWDGERIDVQDIGQTALDYSEIFRREIGGCKEEDEATERVLLSVKDLFCFP